MTKYIKVELETDKPDDTLKLCAKIIKKNTEDGVNSPLIGFVDMAVFAGRVTDVKNKRADAESKEATAQKKHQQAKNSCGLDKEQKSVKKTMLWFVKQVKKLLLLKNENNEEALSEFGFNVVITYTGARRNVRIDIPKTPEDLTDLAEDIIEQHEDLGVDSPLTEALIDMTAFGATVTATRALLTNWAELKGQAQSLNNQALVILGYQPDQTIDTPDTIYHDLARIRDRLLQKYDGEEETLSEYGFDVVISYAVAGRKKGGATVITVQITLPMGQNGNLDISQIIGSELGEPKSVDFQSIDSNGKFFASETEAGLPGAGPVYDVAAGDKLTKSPVQVSAELGLSEPKPFLNVQNSGLVTGTYKVTFRF